MNRSCNSILCRFGIHTADSYEGQSVGETLSMLPLELADREIDKSWWFFNTFAIKLK